MNIVSISYSNTSAFSDPQLWLEKISFYTGILEALAEKHEVSSIENIDYEGKLVKNKVNYFFLRSDKNVERFPFRRHGFLKKLQPDAVLVNGFIFPLQIIQLRLLPGKKVKIIVLHRAEKPARGLKKIFQRLAAGSIDYYLFSSQALADSWIDNHIFPGRSKFREVLQASSGFKMQPREAARKKTFVAGSPVFLWVGRLDANKDPVTVIKAFLQYLDHHPAASLYMIYQQDDLLNEIVQLIAASGKSSSVKLIGEVPHHQLEDWMNSADFIIAGSHYEGSGISVIEAMSCGCIPVVTDIASFRIITGDCGLRYPPGNVQALVNVLIATESMDPEKESEKVISHFNTQLSFPAIAGKIDALIRS